jgi:hexosaminidase
MIVRTCFCVLLSALPSLADAAAGLSVVPQPARLERVDGTFALSTETRIFVGAGGDPLLSVAQQLAESVKQRTGRSLTVGLAPQELGAGYILLTAAGARKELGDEGYELQVTSKCILVRSTQPAGAFYAVQTLRQLIAPPDKDSPPGTAARWTVPGVRIEDRPHFGWRGMSLDVARHFFDKQFVKRYIDYLAAYKINVFHLYLTDDQGWRIEIKRYPRLTEVGAWRKGTRRHLSSGGGDQQKYGGFFTQAELAEIVRYAQQRFITVVPGISMPGHSQAALAAYPELSSTGGPFEVWTEWGISKEVMDPGKEEVFRFVEGVLSEALRVFPSRHIHCGGDEVPRDRWKASPFAQARMRQEGLKNEDELQSYFTRRVERFLNAHGRQLIGWDEILAGGLAPNAVVMSWRGTKGGLEAAAAGHYVVMTPHAETYFNYMQQRPPSGPGHPGYLPLMSVYHFDPLKGMSPASARFVLGGQGCLWTEYVPTPADVEYLLFPRLLAMAEVLWSPAAARDDKDFLRRLPAQRELLRQAGVRCYDEPTP